MGVYEGRGQLGKGMKELLNAWLETRAVWKDANAERFEKKHLHPLRELVDRPEQGATDEAEIERRHTDGLAAERQDIEHKTYAADKRGKGVEEEIRTKYQERLAKIQSQFQAETASIREAHEKG